MITEINVFLQKRNKNKKTDDCFKRDCIKKAEKCQLS